MPTIPKPKFPYAYAPAVEIQHLSAHKTTRQNPAKNPGTLTRAPRPALLACTRAITSTRPFHPHPGGGLDTA